jgi:TolB-like protein/Tfp pilus assembly protein PilF
MGAGPEMHGGRKWLGWHASPNGAVHSAKEKSVTAANATTDPNLDAIPPDQIQLQLERIIVSGAFDASRRNRAFLRFIVEEALAGRSDRIKAYTIATSVLGRDDAFDPQSDPIVRIEASRLRRSLERYYLKAGRDDPIRIEIPKWSYVPSFQRVPGIGEGESPQDMHGQEPPEEQPSSLPEGRERRAIRPAVVGLLTSRVRLVRGAWAALALVLMVGALGGGVWMWRAAHAPDAVEEAVSRGPSIIVLPFENLSGDAARDYLAEGVTEEILTVLGQFDELFVYGRETGAHYGAASSYEELHRELGVRYVLDGSVREAEGRIRVTARLIDATTGVQLWAAAYEEVGSGADLFRVQGDIARRVVTEVAQPYGVIATADMQLARGKAPESLSAYECVLQVQHYYRHMSPARVQEARTCLERATESDPEYADAWALLSMSYLDQVRLRMVPRYQDDDLLDRALQAAQQAAEVAPDSAPAQRALLLAHFFRGEVEQALAAGERALALGPNNPDVLAEVGMRLAWTGQWERGIALVNEAITRNPVHPGWYHTPPALDFYRQGRYAEALEEAKQIDAPGWVHHHTMLAMIYGQLGQDEQAQAAARRVRELDPDFETNGWYELQVRNFPPSLAEHMAEGLRRAGLRIPPQPPANDPSS